MRNKLRIIIPVVILCSCNQVYKEYNKDAFTTLSWKKGAELNFYPEIGDTAKTYDLIFGIRHTYGADIKNINVTLKMISPSGQEIVKEYIFEIADEKGESRASCAGNLCDLETSMDAIQFAETGKYHFVVTHHSESERIRGVMEFGLILNAKD